MTDDIETRLADRAQRGHPREPGPVLAAARQQARRLRRRRRVGAAAVVVVAVLGAAAALAQLKGDSADSTLAVAGPSTTLPATLVPPPVPTSTGTLTTTEAVPTTLAPSTTPADVARRLPGGPERVVALTEGGDLVELSTTDASIRRVLASLGAPTSAWSTVELAPDGSIWVGIDSQVLRVDGATGATTAVAEGVEPRISPDGRYLAYGVDDPDLGTACHADALVVRDLQAGSEHTWTRLEGSGRDFLRCIESLRWAPDGSLITFTLGWEATSVVFAIDPEADRSAPLDARRLGPPPGSPTNWENPTFVGAAVTVVVQAMVPDQSDGGYGPGPVLRVSLATGDVVEEVDLPDHLRVAAYDTAGDHALLLEWTDDGHRQLVHRDAAGDRAVLAVNVLGADW